MRAVPRPLANLCVMFALCAVPLVGPSSAWAVEGLKPAPESWPRWQARLAWSQPVAQPQGGHAMFQLAADRYLLWAHGPGDGGGFRATGAVLWGQTTLQLPSPTGSRLAAQLGPLGWSGRQSEASGDMGSAYLGIGYSTWWLGRGLGLSADMGLLSPRLGPAPRLGHGAAVSGDNRAGDPQWTPAWQVSLAYTF